MHHRQHLFHLFFNKKYFTFSGINPRAGSSFRHTQHKVRREQMKTKVSMPRLITLISVLLFSISSFAETDGEAKPFAEKHVVLQISDPNPFKQTLVLNVANNLIKHYGQDRVDVEIVAFGPGLRLLLADNSNTSRIEGLSGQGVRFSACSNTIKAFTKKLGKEPALNSHSVKVAAGVVRIMDLIDQGYTLVKP
jgi:intracellular sulfur oxidation DsrE/DsrF family protein